MASYLIEDDDENDDDSDEKSDHDYDDNFDDNYMMTKQEFVVATNLTTAGSAEDKLRWAFRMYDKDGSGKHDDGDDDGDEW